MLHSEVGRDKNIEINFVSDARAQLLKPATFFSILSWTPLRIQPPSFNGGAVEAALATDADFQHC